MAPSPFAVTPAGLVVRVSLTPRGGANKIDGIVEKSDGPALKVRVTAAPEKGKANAALIKLLAKSWGLAAGRFSLVGGARERQKRLLIAEADGQLQARLEALAGDLSGK